jgi:hypothetical protein
MGRREIIRLTQLEVLEAEFRELLIPCLRQCVAGRWGIFGTYDSLGADRRYWNWPEADRLRELANLIREIRSDSGERNALCDEFLRLCKLHQANDPGEPKAAKAFLQSLGVPVQERGE